MSKFSRHRHAARDKERKPSVAPQQTAAADQPAASPSTQVSPEPLSKIKRLSEIASFLQSLLTIVGIIAAGAWFITQSEFSHKANITHSITHRKIHDDWTWIHATIEISNVGKRRLALQYGITRLQQILPLDISIHDEIQRGDSLIDKDILIVKWPTIKEYKNDVVRSNIYPGETDKIYYEFVVPYFIETVELYTYFSETKNDPQGWSKITIYDLKNRD